MAWHNLQLGIFELFEEAKRAGRPRKLSLSCLIRADSRREKKRVQYAMLKALCPGSYAAMLERARRNAARWRASNRERYLELQQAKKQRVASARARRTVALVCAKCHRNFLDRSGIGPVPKYCSMVCSHRAATLAWYHRKRAETKVKSGASGRFFVGPHAVKRYRERVHRGITYERALSEILEQAERAHFIKKQALAYRGNAEYWRGPNPMRLRLVVKHNPGMALPTIITILPAADNMRERCNQPS